MKDDRITVAIILKPQGIRGEVKVKAMTDTAEALSAFKSVFIDGVDYSVLSVRAQGEFAYLSLKGIADRNAAELLRGKDVVIPREEAPDPGEGRYYIADLLGSELKTEEGELLGTLKDIRQAATDIYTLEKEGKEIMFPAVKGVITDLDLENKRITVNTKRFEDVAVL